MRQWLSSLLFGRSTAQALREAMVGGMADGLRQWAREYEEERMNVQEERDGFCPLPDAVAILRHAARRWCSTYDIGQTPDGWLYVYDAALARQAVQAYRGPDRHFLDAIHDGTFQRPLMILEVAR